eukprot:2017334-Rhodomonas_salina.3
MQDGSMQIHHQSGSTAHAHESGKRVRAGESRQSTRTIMPESVDLHRLPPTLPHHSFALSASVSASVSGSGCLVAPEASNVGHRLQCLSKRKNAAEEKESQGAGMLCGSPDTKLSRIDACSVREVLCSVAFARTRIQRATRRSTQSPQNKNEQT